MANNILIDGLFVNESPVEWIEKEIVFDAKVMAQLLVENKEVFEGNNGRGKISICRSKKDRNKFYGTLSTWIPTQKEAVSSKAHMPDRDNDGDDMPF